LWRSLTVSASASWALAQDHTNFCLAPSQMIFLTQDTRPQLSNNSCLTAVSIASILMETTSSVRLEPAARPEAASNFTWVSCELDGRNCETSEAFPFLSPQLCITWTIISRMNSLRLGTNPISSEDGQSEWKYLRQRYLHLVAVYAALLSGGCGRDTHPP
jgi:hypothetical protein